MKKRLVVIALGVLAIPLLGSAAYAAAHSVSSRPLPEVVIPAGANSTGGHNDPVDHDTNGLTGFDGGAVHRGSGQGSGPGQGGTGQSGGPGQNGTGQSGSGRQVSGNGNGPSPTVTTPTTQVSDDGPGHDVGDDHGGAVNGTTNTTVAGHDSGDDHGGTVVTSPTTVGSTTTTVAGHDAGDDHGSGSGGGSGSGRGGHDG